MKIILRELLAGFTLCLAATMQAHQETRPAGGTALALAQAAHKTESPDVMSASTCALRLRLEYAGSHQPVDGLIRLTPLEGAGGPLALDGLFERPAGWFSMPSTADLKVPPGRYRVEATHGIDTTVATATVSCTPEARPALVLALTRFYQPEARGLHGANTHLHLLLHSGRKVGVDLQNRQNADDYLRTVGASDGLDLVYVSYLTAPGAEIVSNDYTDDDLHHLSHGPTQFANGVELRHGGVRVHVAPAKDDSAVQRNKLYPLDSSVVSMTYGHVLLLDLVRRSMLASIGPGLSDDSRATDGVPLREGITDARRQGAGVVWCHGTMGLEEIPDWVAGLIHAQNIYDGGNEGTFDTVYYSYLNAGFKIPFSTGTDWGITDFSRVYVVAPAEFYSKIFLRQLTEGRSYITNEPFLEFSAEQAGAGDTIALARPGVVRVHGRATGRSDFVRLQLVHNGRVVHEAASRPVDGHFEAALDIDVPADASGWLALRIPPVQPYEYRSKYSGPGTNILGKAIFAHTSPVYVTVAGRPVYDRAAVGVLLGRVDEALRRIEERGVFANDAEKDGIRRIYREARDSLVALLDKNGPP